MEFHLNFTHQLKQSDIFFEFGPDFIIPCIYLKWRPLSVFLTWLFRKNN